MHTAKDIMLNQQLWRQVIPTTRWWPKRSLDQYYQSLSTQRTNLMIPLSFATAHLSMDWQEQSLLGISKSLQSKLMDNPWYLLFFFSFFFIYLYIYIFICCMWRKYQGWIWGLFPDHNLKVYGISNLNVRPVITQS